MTEFKQIIGRGTRVRDDYNKLSFNILDYTGSATRLFADPSFDGDPIDETEGSIDQPVPPEHTLHEEPGLYGLDHETDDPLERRKYYFDGGYVEIAHHVVYDLAPDGTQLRVVTFTDYTAEKVRTLYPSAAELREHWQNPAERAAIITALEQRGITFDDLAAVTEQPDADPFDLLCHVAFNAPLRTRRERADRLRRDQVDFFDHYGVEARAVLNDLLDKYAEHGSAQFSIPDVFKVPPLSSRGNVSEIIRMFGNGQQLREAVTQLQNLLYAA